MADWIRTTEHYATSAGSVASCGRCTKACTFKNHTNLLANFTKVPLYTPEDGFKAIYIWPFLHCGFVWKKLDSCQTMAMFTMNCATTCMGTSTICLHKLNSILPSVHLLRHLHDKLFLALSHYSVLQTTEPGSEATYLVFVIEVGLPCLY